MRIRLAAAAIAALPLLAACGSANNGATGGSTTNAAAGCSTALPAAATTKPTNPADAKALDGVTATGAVDLKTAPKVTLGKLPITTTSVARKVLVPGTGMAATASDTVSFRAVIMHGGTGKVLDDAFKAGSPALKFKLDQQDVIPGLLAGLVGAQKGERLVYAIPPAEGFGPAGKPELGLSATDTLIVVADVATVAKTVIPPSTITGAPVASPAGMPTVDFAKDAQEPTVKVPGGAAPAALQQATIVQGTGAEVKKGQTLSAHYHGLLWKDCSIFDSSFRRGEPAAFEIGTGKVIKGWDDVLVGKKVGSRVLIVIPPKDGYGEAGSPPKIAGTDTLVFVVDIVGVS